MKGERTVGIVGFVLVMIAGIRGMAGESTAIPPAFAKCYACHSVNPAEADLPGPNLHGVVGRPAASLPDFEYSAAMRAAGRRGLRWTEEALDRFLRDPQAVVPGTVMGPPGLRDAAERHAAIRYLTADGDLP